MGQVSKQIERGSRRKSKLQGCLTRGNGLQFAQLLLKQARNVVGMLNKVIVTAAIGGDAFQKEFIVIRRNAECGRRHAAQPHFARMVFQNFPARFALIGAAIRQE